MSSYYSNAALYVRDARDSDRYKVSGRAELVRDGSLHAAGTMIDISRGGAAFRAYTPLQTGAKYLFVAETTTPAVCKFGPLPCVVTRSFSNHSYGIQFEIDYRQSAKLEDLLIKMFAPKKTPY
ncbi:MAG: PilZ domain-containing protein [Pseudomonadota bacterium]